MVKNRIDAFRNGVKPHMAGQRGVFIEAQISRCAYMECARNATEGKYCEHHDKRYRKILAGFRSRQLRETVGHRDNEYIYVIGSDFFEPVKIGRSVSPLKRVTDMQTGNPYKLKVFHAFLMTKAETLFLEWNVHVELYGMGFGISGEWFDLGKDDAEAVIRKCATNTGVTVWTPVDMLRAIAQSRTPYVGDDDWLAFRDGLEVVHRSISS